MEPEFSDVKDHAEVEMPEQVVSTDSLSHVLKKSQTILVADDDPVVLDILRETLSRQGYPIVLAQDGEEAIQQLERHGEEIRLAIVDLLMPKRSGLQVLERLKQTAPTVKVILSSGYHPGDSLENLAEDQGVAFLAKPFLLSDLLRLVERLLQA